MESLECESAKVSTNTRFLLAQNWRQMCVKVWLVRMVISIVISNVTEIWLDVEKQDVSTSLARSGAESLVSVSTHIPRSGYAADFAAWELDKEVVALHAHDKCGFEARQTRFAAYPPPGQTILVKNFRFDRFTPYSTLLEKNVISLVYV